MSNSPWIPTKDKPVPKDRAVLLWLAEERHGSRLALSKGFEISNGHLSVIDGLFHFDFATPILAWREVDSLIDELPLGLTGNLAKEPY
ncbi:hypothetical protein [Salipiger mucosus]|uniref:Uncharacterized protein n=1 Tax=Salipiger mucosus DSM 16094 TaxID=1123237 RepID=S9SES8_9RHOB|nr:hypothetical protein [Salipiger mucosus]EPX84794.1 hypothetical protein Salmuc_01367 [Salipiger mucosus DSM 16094]